jgi:hypothetical protein
VFDLDLRKRGAMDFYLVCAHYWGISRSDAKTRILDWYYNTPDPPLYLQLSPRVLDFVPPEARAEALASQGVILGEA